MATYEWISRKRNYDAERKKYGVVPQQCAKHPLQPQVVEEKKLEPVKPTAKAAGTTAGSVGGGSDLMDPLSSSSDPLSIDLDPLSLAAATSRNVDKDFAPTMQGSMDDSFEPWRAKKANILSKYTTSEKLSITTSFLSDEDKEKVIVKTQKTVTVSDKVKNRLEQLDDFEEGSVREMLDLDQQQYVKRIEELNQALETAWESDQRVKSLKIAIQCAKLLADVSVIQFYPSKFVLITDILDCFGRLVYQRIRQKATYQPPGSQKPVTLPESFTPDMVPDTAKETCRNWFFKIASIRELIPRFFVESAILKCYNYLPGSEYKAALLRLAHMIRGIGNPLVATYARCYLCRVGVLVAPEVKDHLEYCFTDFGSTYKQCDEESVQNSLVLQHVEMVTYLNLYVPALDWILQCMAHRSSERVLAGVLDRCEQQCKSGLVLNAIMSSFNPQFVSARATQFCELIKECEETGFPKCELYKALGMNVVLSDPPADCRLTLLNDVWKTVTKLKNPADYIMCAEVWVEFPAKHFGKREVNTLLGDIIKHMTPDRAFQDYYPQLQSVVVKVLSHMHDFSTVFAMDKFLPFIDMFQKEAVRVEMCRNIVEAFVTHQRELTNDPVVINSIMSICKIMHDFVNALTLTDDRRQISSLIIGFMRRIHFGQDFEQQLTFCVDARSSFCNLEPALIFLVHMVNRLAVDTNRVVRGNHTRKTAAFVRACFAYTYITIPSIPSIFSRLQLYLVSAQVAIINQALTQGDAFLKAATTCVAEVPRVLDDDGKSKATEGILVSYIRHFVSSLLVVPDHPDHGVAYILKGLMNVLEEYVWDSGDSKAEIYMNVIVLLSALSQEVYMHSVQNVDLNDSLYGGDSKYVAELSKIADILITKVLEHLHNLSTGSGENKKRQSALALEFFSRLVSHADVSHPRMAELAQNLWNLVQKHGLADTSLMVRAVQHVKQRACEKGGDAFARLAQKMSLQSRT
ncbi:VPS35 endosomal protein-sorting factor-like [Corticium candelabrum]|uniref:VPS35 endosomal protein-sorting factor-like n=1 Tax=Corticium candelabrum TaxID=121492 RepID=UPI002E37C45D|nr:VPS35 endosomal protein-sorting factor-like [Corticium candelabrum]